MDGKQLKNSILQWAIQGKLVPQNPKDEPAPKLLERIAASRNENTPSKSASSLRGPCKGTKQSKKSTTTSRIYRENGIWYEQVGNAEPKDISDDIPFEIPENWAWCRLGDLGVYRKGPFGSSLTKAMFVPKSDKSVKVYEQKNAIKKDYTLGDYYISHEKFETMQSFIVRPNDIIVSCAGTIGETYMLPSDAPIGIINQALMRVGLFDLEISAYWRLFFEYILLKKYSEVMKCVEEYDDAQKQLDKLNKELPEALKKSILQQAIQGKLVPQNHKDEPAQKLLERIAAIRHSEQSEESSKRSKKTSKSPTSRIYRENGIWYEQIGNAEPKDISEDIPFEIPENWVWCRWGDLSDSIQYGYNAPALESGRIKMVRISDIHDNKIEWDKVPYCQIKEAEIPTYQLQKNDILFARTGGTVGKSYLVGDVPTEAVYAGYLIRTRYNADLLNPQYLKFFMESSLYWEQLHEGTIATAQPNCNGKTLGKMLLPLPPLAEQKRIVTKLEQLFKVI